MRVKVAVTAPGALKPRLQTVVPVQVPPDQPPNSEPVAGVAAKAKVACGSVRGTLRVHGVGAVQLSPAPVTVPLPVPAKVTLTGTVSRPTPVTSAMARSPNEDETVTVADDGP